MTVRAIGRGLVALAATAYTRPLDINNRGQIAGEYDLQTGGAQIARALGLSPATSSHS